MRHPPIATQVFAHPRLMSRRTAIQAGAIGLLGLGMNHVEALRAAAAPDHETSQRACIYIFLSGGLAQQDSFDLKPDALVKVRCGDVALTEGRMGRMVERIAVRVVKPLRRPRITLAMFENAGTMLKRVEAT